MGSFIHLGAPPRIPRIKLQAQSLPRLASCIERNKQRRPFTSAVSGEREKAFHFCSMDEVCCIYMSGIELRCTSTGMDGLLPH